MRTPPISPTDYQRIFRTVYSVLSTQKVDLTVCCHYFNFYAAAILAEHYKLGPTVHVGVAAYRIHPEPTPFIAFFSTKDGKVDPDGENEHCWIRLDGWHLDFTSPLFPELAAKGNLPTCKRKRFMKPVNAGKEHPNQLKSSGDFFALSNQERSHATNDHYQKEPVFMDLLDICCEWFRKPPAKMPESIPMSNSTGMLQHVQLARIAVEGEW